MNPEKIDIEEEVVMETKPAEEDVEVGKEETKQAEEDQVGTWTPSKSILSCLMFATESDRSTYMPCKPDRSTYMPRKPAKLRHCTR